MAEKQWHLRVHDAPDVVAGVVHEQQRSGTSRQDTVLALVREGLEYRRWVRDQQLMAKYLQDKNGTTEP